MLSNTIVKLSAVFLFATPAVLIGGEIYSVLTGSTPLEGFLKIYSVLYIIPGIQPPEICSVYLILQKDNFGGGVLCNDSLPPGSLNCKLPSALSENGCKISLSKLYALPVKYTLPLQA